MINEKTLNDLKNIVDKLKLDGKLPSSIGEVKASHPIQFDSLNMHAMKQMDKVKIIADVLLFCPLLKKIYLIRIAMI